MQTVKIGFDEILNKEILKIAYHGHEMPGLQLFNANDVLIGNPSSNIAVAFVYTWKEDSLPKLIRDYMQKISNYAYIAGLWRTTNGAKYVFSNILANPNVNKFVLIVFGQKDNGHLLVEALTKFWLHGVDENGIIRSSLSPNPKFEQVPKDALERIRMQCDLVVMTHVEESQAGYDKICALMKACIQEPKNAVCPSSLGAVFYSAGSFLTPNPALAPINASCSGLLYDCGARFEEPLIFDLSSTARNVHYEQKELVSTIGQSLQAETLEDAHDAVAAFIFKNGLTLVDQRDIITLECRTFSVTVLDPLKKIPSGFSDEYLGRYAHEFMNGICKGNASDEFVYTYHERIFRRWGNQYEKAVSLLRLHPNTRRAMISLWDPASDIQNTNAPCLDFIWAAVRNNKLEFHVVYRSHHLATVTRSGRLMKGEGAFVPNLYAIASMQDKMAKELCIERGPLILTDLSGHLYVSNIK